MSVNEQERVQIVLYAEFTAKPGCAETVEPLVAELTTKVRQEPGNQVFTSYREKDNTDRFFVYEVYRDAEAFDAHLSAEYGATFNAELAGLILEEGSQLTHLVPID